VGSARQLEDERLLARMREVHEANYCAYGYRRTWKALRRAGEQAPRCRVQRLMARQRDPGRQAPRQAMAHARSRCAPAARLGQPRLHSLEAGTSFSYLRCWEGVVFFAFTSLVGAAATLEALGADGTSGNY
jgi:putative transposase